MEPEDGEIVRPRVLIVEDEAMVATGLEMDLEDADIEVVGWATHGAEALRLAAEHHPTVALVDIQLRAGDDGVAIAAELHARHQVEIVFLTAQTDPATQARARAVPHRAYLRKPYNPEHLVSAVRMGAAD